MKDRYVKVLEEGLKAVAKNRTPVPCNKWRNDLKLSGS